MRMVLVKRHWLAVAAMVGFMAGCSGLQLESAPSRTVALSGIWVVDSAASDDVDSALRPDARRGDAGKRLSTEAEIRRIRLGSGLAFVAQDIQVLQAQRLEIELAPDSMGVQHFPGVYRDVSWGIKERGIWQVHAGWQQDVLVIASQTKGIEVLERYQLRGADRLFVSVDIRADGNHRLVNLALRRLQ